jgi:hypothetical protein
VNPDSDAQLARVWAKQILELLGNDTESKETIPRETSHHHRVILSGIWEPTNCHVAVPNGFDLEHPSSTRNVVELMKDGLK